MVSLRMRVALNMAMVVAMVLLNVLVPASITKGFIIFLSVVTTVLVQMQLWFWHRIVSPLRLWPRAHSVVAKLFVAFCVASFAGPILAKAIPGVAVTELAMGAFLCNVWLFFLCLFFSVVRRVVPKNRQWSRPTESVIILCGVLLLAGAASYEARLEYQIHRVKVHLGLSNPLSVTLITDLHFGPVLGLDFCMRVADTVRHLNSDIVVLVGDIFDTTHAHMPSGIAECVSSFANRKGSFYVTGNHEYINGAVSKWFEDLQPKGVTVLQNGCKRIGDVVDVVGINDLTAERFEPGQKGDPVKALAECGSGLTKKIVLAHQPNHVREIALAAPDHDVLVLSGHVHGGQIFPMTFFVRFFNDYFHGLYRVSDRLQVYVGRGTGQWGPRFRLGARAEITKLSVT